MPKDTGGPAFPFSREWTDVRGNQTSEQNDGISVRDYFAAQALPEVVAAFLSPNSAWTDYDDVADSAYNLADAMLRRREK